MLYLLYIYIYTYVYINLPTKNLPGKISWLKLSGESPVGLGITPLKIEILLESKPLKSRILVRRLAVFQYPHVFFATFSPNNSTESVGNNAGTFCCIFRRCTIHQCQCQPQLPRDPRRRWQGWNMSRYLCFSGIHNTQSKQHTSCFSEDLSHKDSPHGNLKQETYGKL